MHIFYQKTPFSAHNYSVACINHWICVLQWTDTENPPYSYYIYYMYANITVLNHFREVYKLTFRSEL